jgi:predicted RNA-binding protein with PUA-like domain
MATQYWLVKQEPESFSWDQFVTEGRTAWTGVRNFQARNHLRQMKKGDSVFYYHSGTQKQVVGLARVEREAYADPTAEEGDWSCVDLVPVRPLARPITLAEIRDDKILGTMAMLKQTRLSVTPVSAEQHARLKRLAEMSPP